MSQRPNVIFILSDQHNAKCLGHAGHAEVKTPHLDRMAREGTRFTTAITQNPICTPSRVSFLSGQYCHNHGIYGLCGPQPNGVPNMLGYFRKNGYTTAAIGKIHCPEHWIENDSDCFREVLGWCSVVGAGEYMEHIREQGLVEEHAYSEDRKGVYGQCIDGYMATLAYRDLPEGYVVTESLRFMREARDAGKPFFLHASFPRPHQTYAPSREFWEMYDENKLTLPPNWDYPMKDKAPHVRALRDWAREAPETWTVSEPRTYEGGCRRKLRGYYGNISMVDHAVGELLDFLRAAGLAENTIVVYSADHGDYAGEHGLVEKAPGMSADAITRIPFIWWAPGRIKAEHVSDTIVEAVDVAPTLCAQCGLDPLETADGKNLSALLAGGTTPVHSVGVTEFAWSKSIRKGKYRFVYYPREMFAKEYPDGFGELYDLEADPWEMSNRYFDPACQSVVNELKGELMDWLITSTRVVSTLRARNPEGPQSAEHFHRRVNADNKISPDCLRNLDCINYL